GGSTVRPLPVSAIGLLCDTYTPSSPNVPLPVIVEPGPPTRYIVVPPALTLFSTMPPSAFGPAAIGDVPPGGVTLVFSAAKLPDSRSELPVRSSTTRFGDLPSPAENDAPLRMMSLP